MPSIYDTLKNNSHMVFLPQSCSLKSSLSKRVLIFVPDLSLNGAQTVLFSLTQILIILGYEPTLISSEDGEYRDKYLELGCTIAIRPNVSCSYDFKIFLNRCFDLVIINTSSCLPYIYFFINKEIRVIWWLHETKEQLVATGSYLPAPQLLSENITYAAAHRSVQRGMLELHKAKIPVLPIPVPDEDNKSSLLGDDNITSFFIPAAYTYIKGQDILLKAIASLPEEYKYRSHFVFCGYSLPSQEDYRQALVDIGNKLSNVTMLNSLSQGEVFEYYRKSDCVVAPSRIDSGPASIIEAMMFGKLTLVSSQAGVSEYITDCINGFVFHDEKELFQRLLLIISDKLALKEVANKGQIVYKNNFHPDTVSEILNNLITQSPLPD